MALAPRPTVQNSGNSRSLMIMWPGSHERFLTRTASLPPPSFRSIWVWRPLMETLSSSRSWCSHVSVNTSDWSDFTPGAPSDSRCELLAQRPCIFCMFSSRFQWASLVLCLTSLPALDQSADLRSKQCCHEVAAHQCQVPVIIIVPWERIKRREPSRTAFFR